MSDSYGLWQMMPPPPAPVPLPGTFRVSRARLFIHNGTSWMPLRTLSGDHLPQPAVSALAEWLTLHLLKGPSTQRRVHGAYDRQWKSWEWAATFSDVKKVAEQLSFIVDSRLWRLPADHPFVDGTSKP